MYTFCWQNSFDSITIRMKGCLVLIFEIIIVIIITIIIIIIIIGILPCLLLTLLLFIVTGFVPRL